MIRWAFATVVSCLSSRQHLQKIEVLLDDGAKAKAYHYTDVGRPVVRGDRVLLNTTAVELALGTGGYHFVHNVLIKEDETKEWPHIRKRALSLESEGHLMKQRYTPQQRAVLAVEEEASPYHHIFKQEKGLAKLPILIGELHSMLPIAMCWLEHLKNKHKRQLNIVYIWSDGGALPLALSDHVAALNDLGWLRGTITYGQAYGGDLEAMNKYTALLAAKHILKADIVLVMMGPGIAGTGTMFGHTGVEVGELINAVSVLEGTPIVIPRISFADERERHQGISHHTLSSLSSIAVMPAQLPLPNIASNKKRAVLHEQIIRYDYEQKHRVQWVPSPSIAEMKSSFLSYPLPITTMTRGVEDDPDFFQAVCSAAQVAYDYCLKG